MKNAFVWSIITNYSAIIIQFIATVALARLLTPSEVGAYAIAGSIFVIAQMFRDFGISTYLVREQNASRDKIEGAIALSWIVCTILAGLLFLSSPYIANFYNLPVLQTIFTFLSFNILIIPLGTWSQSQLKKEMKFRTIGAIQVTSQVTHLIISIALALLEFGSVSLAIASFFATLVTVILTLWACPNHNNYRPRFSNVTTVFRATSTIGGANVVYQLSANIHPIVLGKVLSEEAVAIFDKSAAILNLLNMAFINAIQSVLAPYFALIKKDPNALKSTYFRINNYTAVVAWPFLIYASLHADLIVRILFGDQWLAATPLVPFACIGFAVAIIGRFFNEVAIAIGLESKVFKINLLMLINRLFIILYFSQFGLLAFTQALIFQSVVRVCIVLFYLSKYADIKASEVFISLLPSFYVSIIVAIPAIFFFAFETFSTNILVVLIHSLVVIIIWIFSLKLCKHELYNEVKPKLIGLKSKLSK